MSTLSRARRALTLVELLLVVLIIALLCGIVFAAAGPAREAARRRVCVSNLRQIGQALRMYMGDYDGTDPVEGQLMEPSELGLPTLRHMSGFVNGYVRDRGILACPDYHEEPPRGARALSTYMWNLSASKNMPRRYWFSTVLARRGTQTPVVTCDQHNGALDERGAARWLTMDVDVLRLDGSARFYRVPVRTTPSEW